MSTSLPAAGAPDRIPRESTAPRAGDGPERIDGRAERFDRDAENRPWRWGVLLFLVSCAVVISRRPDAIFHPQFYAEDGAIWFADAYNRGWWRALVWPYNGYIQVLPRLTAALALLIPFSYAPLVENLIAIAVQALPAVLLLSPRSRAWGSLRFRAALAALYLALPNTEQIMATISNSLWPLALCAFLLVVAAPPRGKRAWSFDGAILFLCGLTGPFCLFLLPIVLYLLWRRPKDAWLRFATAVFLFGSIVQSLSLLAHHGGVRGRPPLGASLESFFRLLGGQVYFGTLLGGTTLSVHLSFAAIACIAAAGSLMIAGAVWTSGTEMRLFLILVTLIFAASLANPVVLNAPPGMTAWGALAHWQGTRYWFFPSLAFAWSLAWCLRSGRQALQMAAGALFVLMIVGLIRDYRYPALPDLNFPLYARRLNIARPGSVVVIPESPPGWNARLLKR